eukprot:TRINITY_DN13812_c0_g1_i1.p1 TRINITY_DN13812_c0_g1~~TRINITY_DN13812_c0_g1_i1.p1  ORF type:complete len:1002 (+),score=113.36 TRINITY_DN13812_c0_g1_i1:286-3006(+)
MYFHSPSVHSPLTDFTECLKARQLKVLSKASLSMDYILYCLAFYHTTESIAQTVKQCLANEISSEDDRTADDLRMLYITKLRDAAVKRVRGPAPTVTSLRLSNNQIGDQGVKHIATALLYNTTLTKLHLSRCSVTDVGVESLSSCLLTSNTTLTSLDLSHNAITDSGGVALVEIFEQNTVLTSLKTDGNMISMEIESVLEKCTQNNRTAAPQPDVNKRLARCLRSVFQVPYSGASREGHSTIPKPPYSIAMPNGLSRVENGLLSIKSLLLLGKGAKALERVEELLEDPVVCPTGGYTRSNEPSPPPPHQDEDRMDEMALERILSQAGSPTGSQGVGGGSPPLRQPPFQPGKPRPVKNQKYVPFYHSPEKDYQHFINSYGESAFAPSRTRYALFYEADKAWRTADWITRMDVIRRSKEKYEGSPKPKGGEKAWKAGVATKNKSSNTVVETVETEVPATPSTADHSITLTPNSIVFEDLKRSTVTIHIENGKLYISGVADGEFEVDAPFAYDMQGKFFVVPYQDDYLEVGVKEESLIATIVAHVARLGREAGVPLKILEDEPETSEKILPNGDAVIPYYKTVEGNCFTFEAAGDSLQFRVGGGSLQYSVNGLNRTPFKKLHFDGLDTLEIHNPPDEETILKKPSTLLTLPVEDLPEILGKLRCLCGVVGVAHDIPEKIVGYTQLVESRRSKEAEAKQREKDLMERGEMAGNDGVDLAALESVGKAGDCEEEVAIPDGESPKSVKVVKLGLVGVPTEHFENFSFLSRVVLYGFMEVQSRQPDFTTLLPKIVALTNTCFYVYTPSANVEYCLPVASIKKLLIGQALHPDLSLHLAIIADKAVTPPTHDLMLTGTDADMKSLTRLLRSIYYLQTKSRLPLEQLPDTANLRDEIKLDRPEGYEINYIQPTER